MTGAWIALGLVVALLVAVVAIGLALPSTYRGRVLLDFDRPPAEVWEALTDYRRYPCAASMARAVEPADVGEAVAQPDLPGWVEDLGASRVRVETLEARAPEFLRRRLADVVVPIVADWAIRLEPLPRPDGPAGCRVEATNSTTIGSGTWHVPLFRIVMALTGGAERALRDYLGSIARGLGEPARFE